MFLQWIGMAALCGAFGAVTMAQEAGFERRGSNVIKRLPGYVRLLPGSVLEPKKDTGRGKMAPAEEPKGGCAHILLVPIPENIDPGIEVRLDSKTAPMPKYRGLPPCPQDRR